MQLVRPLTLSDMIFPRTSLWRDLALVVGMSVLTGLAAQVAIPLPFSPVPVTGQTFAVLLAGALLGSRRGALSQVAYIAEGLVGMPVFAGGHAGVTWALGPTGGYLVGFVAAALVVGWLAERGWDRRVLTAALAMAIGNVIIYMFGLVWLTRFVAPEKILLAGLLPFLAGDTVKIALASVALPAGWRLIR